MKEHDPLDTLLRDWTPPEPAPRMDRNIVAAYRSAVRTRMPLWQRFVTLRVSIPAPVLLAAAVAIAVLMIWLKQPARSPSRPETHGIVTQLNARGFQPLPDGEARIIPVAEGSR
jgi:hypothetical protein